MKGFLGFIGLLSAGIIFTAVTSVSAEDITPSQAPVVIELFTSQSCSSCPPADRVLGKLAKHDNVIALSCNVTYWNHLHWKDTLSKQFCTDKQRFYAHALKARGPYTPQAVINGRYEMVGSRESAVSKTVQRAAHNQEIVPISMQIQDGTLSFYIPEIANAPDNLNINLYRFSKDHVQTIPKGENRNRIVKYTNPVKEFINLGRWNGTQKRITHGVKDNENYAVLVQSKSTGRIYAAGQIKSSSP